MANFHIFSTYMAIETLPLPPKDVGQIQLWFINKRKTLLKDIIRATLGLTVTAETNNSDLLYRELYTCEN